MRPKLIGICALLISQLFGVPELEASPSIAKVSSENGQHYERVVVNSLMPILKSAGRVGRIYYQATCPPDEHFPLAFPRIAVHASSSKGGNALASIRRLFQRNELATVVEDKDGIIRVKIGTVSDIVLRTPIAALHFDLESQYNYLLAIGTILKVPEVQAIMEKLNVRVPARPYHIHVVPPSDAQPHLPSVITNVTMDQALDVVARTWGGVVLYGACTRPDTYEVFFSDIIYSNN